MKQPVRIFSHGDCYVDSYYNGGAYEIGIANVGSVFLQGDDASAWRAEFDSADAILDPIRCEACKVDLVIRYIEVM